MPSSKGFKSTLRVPGHFKKVIITLCLCSPLAAFLLLALYLNFLTEILLQQVLTMYYNNKMVNESRMACRIARGPLIDKQVLNMLVKRRGRVGGEQGTVGLFLAHRAGYNLLGTN